jgi:AcrR family transcriptional regulator
MLVATTGLTIAEGYVNLTVGRIVAAAGVSRPTFYEHFADREECFATALAPIAEQLLADVNQAVADEAPQHALSAAAQALLDYACSQPAQARLLMSDALTGGSRLRAARDGLLDDAARSVEQAHGRASTGASISALPPRLALGAICRMLAPRLCGAPLDSNELAGGVSDWIAAYGAPLERDCWRSLAALAPVARSPFLPPTALSAPRARRARVRAADGTLAEEDWLRIVFAAAEVVQRDGNAATVAQIAAAAGVDARVFYRFFTGKQMALAAAGELLFRHAIAAAAGAFVAGESWPERVWEAARALMQYADQNPMLTHISLVECYGSEARDGRQVQDLAQAFTVFLQEGQLGPARSAGGSPEILLEAISMGVFELCYRHVRESRAAPISSLLGQLAFIALAPFLGPLETGEFLVGCSSAGRDRAGLVA